MARWLYYDSGIEKQSVIGSGREGKCLRITMYIQSLVMIRFILWRTW